MTESPAHGPDVGSIREQVGRVEVPEVVEANSGEPELIAEACERERHVSGTPGHRAVDFT